MILYRTQHGYYVLANRSVIATTSSGSTNVQSAAAQLLKIKEYDTATRRLGSAGADEDPVDKVDATEAAVLERVSTRG